MGPLEEKIRELGEIIRTDLGDDAGFVLIMCPLEACDATIELVSNLIASDLDDLLVTIGDSRKHGNMTLN